MGSFQFPGQKKYYKGKVRDVYSINEDLLVMIASDRISAFDVILPKTIPYKGQVLNQLAAFMLEATKQICPNWLLSTPAPNVSVGNKCIPIKIEMVVRGNLTGHAWRTYKSGKRELCGVKLPEGMKENDYFKTPIITPSTKAEEGHDEDISVQDIIANGLVSKQDWSKLEDYALKLFAKGREMATQRSLILVDTKYEFGKIGEEIILMDEIHTPDSSRYFFADGFEQRLERGEKQQQLSKEFVREWLLENNFMGQEGQRVPEMTTQWVEEISNKYIQLFELITNKKFIPEQWNEEQTYEAIIKAIS